MRRLHFRSLIPNLITLSGLSFGLSSIRFAIEGEFNLAVICILFAAVCDFVDGMLARHLDSESDLGFQLDSLSDFLSFGVAPGILIYMAIFDENSSIGVFSTLMFIIFSCLRLALFNVLHEKLKHNEIEKIDYFTGIPTPAGAILFLLPLTHVFMGYGWVYENINFVAGYIILISGLLVSKIPTFSFSRGVPIRSKFTFLILFSMLVLSMINLPWHTLNVLALIYLLTIPFSVFSWQKERNKIVNRREV